MSEFSAEFGLSTGVAPVNSLQVVASPGLGGAETAFLRIGAALTAAGHATLPAVRRGSELARALGASARTLPMRNYFDVQTVLGIRRVIRQTGVSVVQSWMSRATWLTRAPRGCLHVARIGGYYRPVYFRHAQAWVVNTRGLHDWLLREGFPADRLACIYNFVPEPPKAPPPFTREQLGIPPDALVIATMGRFVDKKGFEELIDAFEALGPRIAGRPLHLLAMGAGPMLETLRARCRNGRAHLPGWVSQPLNALPLADVFVCPSREEAFGNVIIEAWSLGLPVLSTRSAGGLELIRDGQEGLLCDIQNADSMAAQLRRMLESPALREELAANGHARFRSSFSADKTVAAYLDFYTRMRRLHGLD
jgi:glycosyltransferase involved in cell wall biosynthesis